MNTTAAHRTVSLAEVEADFSRYVEESKSGPIIITEHDRPVAALVSVSDPAAAEQFGLPPTQTLQQILDARAEEIQSKGAIANDEFWRAVDAEYGERDDDERE